VRAHDQTSRRERSRAWLGLILVAATTAALARAPRTARGQDAAGTGPDAASAPAPGREPIDLAARRVRVWRQGGEQWVHLSGEVAVLQGVEGLRAGEAVVRVTELPTPGGTVYRLDVYAEGLKSPGPGEPQPPARVTLRTNVQVRLRPYQAGGLERLDAPPKSLPLLARAGLDPFSRPPAARGPVAAARLSASADTPAPVEVETLAEAGNPRHAETPPAGGPGGSPLPLPEPTGSPVADLPPAAEARGEPQAALPPDGGPAKLDPKVVATQFPGGGVDVTDGPSGPDGGGDVLPPAAEAAPMDSAPMDSAPTVPELPGPSGPSTELVPLPAPGSETVEAPPATTPPGTSRTPAAVAPTAPILPGTQRITRIFPRSGATPMDVQRLPLVNGVDTVVVRGGVNIVTSDPKFGDIDITADSAIIWRRVDAKGKGVKVGPNGEQIEDANQPMELYLEGDVVVRQDERKVAGNGDQKTYRARAAYYDLLSGRSLVLEAELAIFAPGLVAPVRIVSPRIEQYRPLQPGTNGRFVFGNEQIRADKTMTTGSRFPHPGYRFNSKSVDVYRVLDEQTDPNTGRAVGSPRDPKAPQDLTWRIDARQNVFYMGPVPVFYWPRFVADAEDFEPPLRNFTFRTNNYFGQQALADFNGFRLLGLRKPNNIDVWNVDVDYLSARTKNFPALGSEIGWFGNDLINDVTDPYHRAKGVAPSFTRDYFGYFDIWGLKDSGRDVLGSGPAIITNNRAAGDVGYQRGGGGPKGAVPAFTNPRGRFTLRHMQRFLPDDEEHLFEDLRLQVEVGATTDRYFLEEYYKRLFDTGMDQETLLYLVRQKENRAFTVWAEANLQNWQTETQWLPRLDYYRLGDSFLADRLTYFQHSGADYASTHTASEVNNPNIFAFLPYDPISNTSGTLNAGRAYTNHEVDLPLNFFDNVFRVVPYAQGQLVGWSNQINGQSVGRYWGAAGIRAETMAWKAYPWVQSETFNVHGLNHKINFEGDFRTAYSNVGLNRIGVQDDLDDNSYESTRRYLALTNYAGGVLPAQYDPRFLILRRAISPITGPTDIQATIETLNLGVHQRLQTKRGPEGRRRVIDWMTFDLDTVYFPNAARDNFNKPFGQNRYNYQWFLGDRTSIVSNGWFEFFNIGGQPIFKTNNSRHNDPFGLNVVTTGVSLSRPPRGNIFVGYTVINTGPINTSAVSTSMSYWLSPKWYGTYGTMYDFGNGILLSAVGSLTRIGSDYLTSVGLTVDPQRQSYMFAVQVSPRLSPSAKLGSGVGLNNFDSRYAPTE